MAIENYFAYFKFEGSLVEDGYFDARKSGEVLLGIDEIVRHFLIKEEKSVVDIDFEIPIRVRKGSWEALLPHNFSEWFITALGIGMSKYAATAVTEIAKKDFKDKGIKDVVKEAFKGIKWVIALAKHLGTMKTNALDGGVKQDSEGEQMIELRNDAGETLMVPEKFLRSYLECPPLLFERITKYIQQGRELEIGTVEKLDNQDIAPKVTIKVGEKYIFAKSEEEEDILFPELTHGLPVQLLGHVTKANEKENTLGFEYNNHILMCTPLEGKIARFKPSIFRNCMIEGVIDRETDNGNYSARKPSIRFSTIADLDIPLGNTLFNG